MAINSKINSMRVMYYMSSLSCFVLVNSHIIAGKTSHRVVFVSCQIYVDPNLTYLIIVSNIKTQTRHRKIIGLPNNPLNIYMLNKIYIKYLHTVVYT